MASCRWTKSYERLIVISIKKSSYIIKKQDKSIWKKLNINEWLVTKIVKTISNKEDKIRFQPYHKDINLIKQQRLNPLTLHSIKNKPGNKRDIPISTLTRPPNPFNFNKLPNIINIFKHINFLNDTTNIFIIYINAI